MRYSVKLLVLLSAILLAAPFFGQSSLPAISLFDYIPSAYKAAIQSCSSSVDVSSYINSAIAAAQTGFTSRRIYAPKGCYAVGSTITFGSNTASIKSIIFEGEGTYDNYSSGTSFIWIGVANGTIMQVTSAQNSIFKNFTLDGNRHSPGIGLLVTALNSGGGSNHQNIFDNLAVADIPGTPGRAISIDGNFYANNQDVCCSSWSNIRIYSGISSSVVTGIYQAGIQSVNHYWFGHNSVTGYSSRGMDFEAGDVRVSNVEFSGPSSGANLDDIYVAPGADWVTIRDTYSEINSSSSPNTRHFLNMPAGTRRWPTLVSGARILWGLSSGNPIYIAQTGGPYTFEAMTIDGTPSGSSSVYVNTAGSVANPVNLIGNFMNGNVSWNITGNRF